MDPWATVGAVSSVVQIATSAVGLVKATREIHSSSQDTSEENTSIEAIAASARKLTDNLPHNDDCAEEIAELVAETKFIADELLGILQALKIQGPKTKWKSFIAAIKDVKDRGKVVNFTLFFETLQARFDTVKGAYLQTYEYLFDVNDSDHKEGKAGSGKSTLMKFIWGKPEVTSYLKGWSNGRALVTGDFFFWSGGTDLRKFQEGLLRSLLFEVLRQSPHLTSYLPPQLSKRQVDWDTECLKSSLLRILSSEKKVCFWFFIDGLDEFSGPPEELVEALEAFSHHENINFCIPSCPWTEFLDAYGLDPHRFFKKLEDLTKNDIRLYAQNTLQAHPRFGHNRRYEQGYIRSPLEGSKYGDRISNMQRRLDKFPKDLDTFFSKMLYSISDEYLRLTVQGFLAALASHRPLPLMLHSFPDDVDEDPDYPFHGKVNPLTLDEINHRRDQMRRQLDARSKGLLEVVDSPIFKRLGSSELPDCRTSPATKTFYGSR
ncbi:hypothetical protein B0H63DRAFT_525216 [Podospora didyma]|uniref:NACHT domain-containing protein n=1 Tax=Podospora didyma TaxID=330526 RepID=A0AAE0KK63_9PEZI|nr:hypothetical protein B0H63DRAFT_525216 [Podospora didyma]